MDESELNSPDFSPWAFSDRQDAFAQQRRQSSATAAGELRDRLGLDPRNPALYLQLAKLYQKQEESERFISTLREGLSQCEPSRDLYAETILALAEGNRIEESLALARQAAEALPNHRLFFELREALLLPAIYRTAEEVDTHRERFSAGLNKLSACVDLGGEAGRTAALEAITFHDTFNLAYQGRNDWQLLGAYGRLVHRIMAANYPEWAVPKRMPSLDAGKRVRLGYVSAHFSAHSVSTAFLGTLRDHDRSRFEVFVYHLGITADRKTEEVRQASDHFLPSGAAFEQICQSILADDLHVLVFLDPADPATIKLASLRLAPIQCALWGLPWTSGLPTMDYFISTALREPENGQDHYTEKLIRLPGIGASIPRPVIPRPLLTRTRSHFGLGEDRTVYLCSQSVGKYLPQHDALWPAIARQIPNAQFVFVVPNDSLRWAFSKRLERVFSDAGISAAEHCVLYPVALSLFDYWNLNLLCDVFLDSLDYSGFLSTLDAISCGLPIVTLPGELHRGRQSYALLMQMGISETIATDKGHYVELAVRLAKNRGFREHVVARMAAHQSAVFDDRSSVRALEDFLEGILGQQAPAGKAL